jgi:uncharacterized membrane protein
MEKFISFISVLPDWVEVIVVAATPIFEIRGSLPFATEILNMNFWHAYVLSLVGNSIPAVVLVFGLESVSRVISEKSEIGRRFFVWWFERTMKKFQRHYELYGALALCLFVAIPLPMTGVWTGSVAAVLFGIRKGVAIPAIVLGAGIAGIAVGFIIGAVHVLV